MASVPQSGGREPLARCFHVAVASNHRMLVWGGGGGVGAEGETSVVESFDVLSGSWQEAQQLMISQHLPGGLHSMAVACDKERAYSFGGETNSQLINDIFEVDLTSLTCRKIVPSADSAPSPSARNDSAMICSRRRLVNYGGYTDAFRVSDELHVFDLDAYSWASQVTAGEKPPALVGHSLTAIDKNKAVLFAGQGWGFHNDTYLLDMETWQWSRVRTSGKKPPARYYHTACLISSDIGGHHPLLMVVGGLGDGDTVFSDVWFLDVTEGSWSEVSLPTDITRRWGHSAVMFGTGPNFRVVVLFGGKKQLLGAVISETTLLFLSLRRGSWVVDRVVRGGGGGGVVDDDVRDQLRRLQISPSTSEESSVRVRELERELGRVRDELEASERRVREREGALVAERERRETAEQRASEGARQTNERVRELEREVVGLQDQLRTLESRVREGGERVREMEGVVREGEEALQEEQRNRETAERRASDVERQVAGLERELREAEGRRILAEERVREMGERVRRATERKREAEERMIRAENAKQQAEERQGDFERRVVENEQLVYRRLQQAEQRERETTSRTQAAERSHLRETERRIEAEQLVTQLEEQLREAERVANTLQSNTLEQYDDVFWKVERDEIRLSERELGRGGWAAVKVAEFRGLQVAAKCLHAIIISDHNRQLFVREMNIAAKLRHPHLVQFIGATLENEPIILTELMATSLRSVLERGRLAQAQIASISRHVALALNYMHRIRPDPILHRDVSSANVLLNRSTDHTWIAKLSDYGSANFTRQVRTAGPGNPSYAAPEASNPSQQTLKMDVYSFGVMLIEMATGRFPDRDRLAAQIRGISDRRVSQLVRRCTDHTSARRPTMDVVIREL